MKFLCGEYLKKYRVGGGGEGRLMNNLILGAYKNIRILGFF